jgi:hypothetical protein
VLWALFGFAHLLSGANEFSPWLHECWEELDGGKGPVVYSTKTIPPSNASTNATSTTERVKSYSDIYGCNRPYQTIDTVVSLYSIVIGIAIATFENLKGWERDGTVVRPLVKSIAYIGLGVPGLFALPTLLAVVFLYLSVALNLVAAIGYHEVFVLNARNPKDVRICPPRNVMHLCNCTMRPASTGKFTTSRFDPFPFARLLVANI